MSCLRNHDNRIVTARHQEVTSCNVLDESLLAIVCKEAVRVIADDHTHDARGRPHVDVIDYVFLACRTCLRDENSPSFAHCILDIVTWNNVSDPLVPIWRDH